nr:MAG TPA: hypothetical protein [Caudoviricetes sp.]
MPLKVNTSQIVSPKSGEKPEWRGLQQDKDYMI